MFDIVIVREPGRSRVSSQNIVEYAKATEEGAEQMDNWKSDSLVVPVKAGNAAGGKEATHW